jgi:hypothetical protein
MKRHTKWCTPRRFINFELIKTSELQVNGCLSLQTKSNRGANQPHNHHQAIRKYICPDINWVEVSPWAKESFL